MTITKPAAGPICTVARRAAIALPAEECQVRSVRHFASAVLTRWGVPADDRVSALLIVGELAANSARHGRAQMVVHISLIGQILHVEIADYGALVRRPAAVEYEDADEHGRGLGIVDALADWWESTESTRLTAGRRTRVWVLVKPRSVQNAPRTPQAVIEEPPRRATTSAKAAPAQAQKAERSRTRPPGLSGPALSPWPP